jgi:hypothetical protein
MPARWKVSIRTIAVPEGSVRVPEKIKTVPERIIVEGLSEKIGIVAARI